MPKIIQTGNSLAVTIPKKFVQVMGLKKGATVKIETHPHTGQVILNFEGVRQLSLTSKKEKNVQT